MANIILKDKNGNDAIFEGVDSVSFRAVGGGSVKFSEGSAGFGSGVIDVDTAPSAADVYLVGPFGESDSMIIMKFQDLLRLEIALPNLTVQTQIVQELPENVRVSSTNIENTCIYLYIVESTGIAYGDIGGGLTTLGESFFGGPGMDLGWSTDPASETNVGFYCVRNELEEGVIYRTTELQDGTNVYLAIDLSENSSINTTSEVMTLEEFIDFFTSVSSGIPKPEEITVTVVDELPESMIAIPENMSLLPVYIVKDTGIAYASLDGTTAMTLGQLIFETEDTSMDMGLRTSSSEMTEEGIYTIIGEPTPAYTFYTYADGVVETYANFDDKLIAIQDGFENEIQELESENESLSNQITTLKNEKTTLNNQINTLNNDKASLNNQISTLNSQVSSLQTEVTTLEDSLNNQLTDYLDSFGNFTKYATTSTTNQGNTRMDSVTDTTIKSIAISDKVSVIAGGALSGCGNLEHLIIPFVGSMIKEKTDQYQYPLGYIFGSTEYEGAPARYYHYYADSFIMAFAGKFCIPTSLKSVTVTGGNILYGALSGLENVTRITLPEGITSIGGSACCACSSLLDIKIPDGVVSIDKEAFAYCSNLANVTLPNSVTSLGESVFSYCRKLVNITYLGTKEQWKAITKGTNWDTETGNYTITCIDGTIAKDGTET